MNHRSRQADLISFRGNLWFVNLFHYSPLGERQISNSIVEEPEKPEFQVIERGTERGKPKLVASDGYAYIVKVILT
jgi:hypothetical protein